MSSFHWNCLDECGFTHDLYPVCVLLPVKEKFSFDKDSEVAATSMKVSLLCPVS